MRSRGEIIVEIRNLLDTKVAALLDDIAQLREDVANESKSSAGDKYETSREMAQQEIRRLENVVQITRQQLYSISDLSPGEFVQSQSLVLTSAGRYYIGSGFGSLHLSDGPIFGLGVEAPAVRIMSGLRAKDTFKLNGKDVIVLDVS